MHADNEAAIQTLIENWAAGVRRKDLGAILRHHTSDMVMFDVPPPFQHRGIDAYAASWDQFFKWSHDPLVFEIQTLDIVAGEDVAVAVATMKCSGTEKDDKDIDLDFRLTVGLRKIDNQWTIFHEHHSIPAEA
ncbi:MAG TPA: SgcJ/EcaC family oxidoreductase [Caulobacteraceae bacterium]|jgi:uncharacterized protein (TIGR02246 family)|nr:SgcJ/EcaC family oxidoreductase [Caulobacteraceae bacterium]